MVERPLARVWLGLGLSTNLLSQQLQDGVRDNPLNEMLELVVGVVSFKGVKGYGDAL